MVPDLHDCLSIKEKLLREENKFMHRKADTLCQKEYPYSFQILGKKIGPFRVGHTYIMENYVAEIFVKDGYLQYTDKSHIDSKTIQKINFQESTQQELKPIKDLIYIQARKEMKIAKKHNESGNLSFRSMRGLISDVNDLISVRLGKIMRLARYSKNIDAKKRLTQEELILFEKLSKDVKEWQNYLSNPLN